MGRAHVLTGGARTRRFTSGYRFGGGRVAAVVRPGSLVEQWRVFLACARADVIIIVQAANTGLTGGSTPDGVYDRPVIIISTTRIDGIHLILGGRQAVCLSGSTLFDLESRLKSIGREPHSVIGSSCIGASVVGGICNNSGGALVRRGPAYTEYALFARINADGEPELCDRLGLSLGAEPETILRRLDAGAIDDADVHDVDRRASARDYGDHVRRLDQPTPARFNADPGRLLDVSGCAGKVMALAVRVDTFEADERSRTFYVGTNDPAQLTSLRRALLTSPAGLPVLAEYMHRDAYELAERYGKDTVIAIERLGTHRLPGLFSLKARIDALARRLPFLPEHLSDRLLQAAARIAPRHLPERLIAFRDRYDHHLILKVADAVIEPTALILANLFGDEGGFFECTPGEEEKALLHRFAVAGAAVRYRAIHPDSVEEIIALDVALRRDDADWFETLPADLDDAFVARLYYGHFLCHVFHQDYIVRKGRDPLALEHRMWALLDERGARYPAEHNVGHLYPASADMVAHYRSLDPSNSLNPGIGKTSRDRGWSPPPRQVVAARGPHEGLLDGAGARPADDPALRSED